MNSKQRLDLVWVYARREGMQYEEALALLTEEAAEHDDAEEFLEEIGLEMDYVYDALVLMGEGA